MLKMRLQRIGKRGQAYFRVIVTEHTTKPKGRYLELLGSYDPHQKQISVKQERVTYWTSKGAQMSPTLNNLLITKGIIQGEKLQSWRARPPKKQKADPASAKASETISASETLPAVESVPEHKLEQAAEIQLEPVSEQPTV